MGCDKMPQYSDQALWNATYRYLEILTLQKMVQIPQFVDGDECRDFLFADPNAKTPEQQYESELRNFRNSPDFPNYKKLIALLKSPKPNSKIHIITDREAEILVYVAEHPDDTYPEIAQILETTTENIKTNFHRAISKLRAYVVVHPEFFDACNACKGK